MSWVAMRGSFAASLFTALVSVGLAFGQAQIAVTANPERILVGQSVTARAVLDGADISATCVFSLVGADGAFQAGLGSVSAAGFRDAAQPLLVRVLANCPGSFGSAFLEVVPQDQDGDSVEDGWETETGLNQQDPADGVLDPDQDGLDNRREFEAGTDPFNRDTDGDGVSDAAELARGYDPLDGTRFELDGSCVISVLNRSVQAKGDGSWSLPNIPANLGRVRARATCQTAGVTRSGVTDYFGLTGNGRSFAPDILAQGPALVPMRISLSSQVPSLAGTGATAQLLASAVPASGEARDVTVGEAGTNYTISNPAIATVSADGLVTAVSSGTVLITAMNDGATGMIRLQVITSSDSDGDGIPDDVEIANGMNPNDPVDALEDFDRDGLINRDEIAQGTGLRNPDTDNDGLLDGREIERGTDPLVVDTDGDGVADGLEVQTPSRCASTRCWKGRKPSSR